MKGAVLEFGRGPCDTDGEQESSKLATCQYFHHEDAFHWQSYPARSGEPERLNFAISKSA